MVAFFVAFIMYAIKSEKRRFNDGKCPYCNVQWKQFDMDSQGGRGYDCPRCGKTVWISYPSVDREFLKEQCERETQLRINQYDNRSNQ